MHNQITNPSGIGLVRGVFHLRMTTGKTKKKKSLLKICASECPSRKPQGRAFVPGICMADVANSAGLGFRGVVVPGCLSPCQQSQLPCVVIWAGVHDKLLCLRDRVHQFVYSLYVLYANTQLLLGPLVCMLKQCIFPHGVLCNNTTTTSHSFSGRRGFSAG